MFSPIDSATGHHSKLSKSNSTAYMSRSSSSGTLLPPLGPRKKYQLLDQSKSSSRGCYLPWRRFRYFAFAAVLTVLLIQLLMQFAIWNDKIQDEVRNTSESFGREPRCSANRDEPIDSDRPAFNNPRFQLNNNKRPTLIRNATVWDGLGNVLRSTDVLLDQGIIVAIKPSTDSQCSLKDCLEIQANGRILTPGIVDMHSHEGLSTWPLYPSADDVNEASHPTLPQLRALDAFNAHDASIYLTSVGGVTSSLVLPGSANIMGGEAYVFKNMKRSSVDEMTLNYGREDGWRWMKMAMNENPKRVYGAKHSMQLPQSRMGVAWLMRKKFSDARQLMIRQDQWCSKSTREYDVYPENLELQSLVDLLRGKVRLNVHVYETTDIETLLRISREFNFTVSAIHHATSAYLAADLLAAERTRPHSKNANLTVAIFADKGYYKTEAYHASIRAPTVLKEHGIPFAFKSDHTVTNAQYLPWQAAKAVHYGLSQQQAFMAITSVPAKAMGVANRIGSIREGMDADVVLWEKNPMFEIGASPAHVIIDGQQVFSKFDSDASATLSTIGENDSENAAIESKCPIKFKKEGINYVYFQNLKQVHLNFTHHYVGDLEAVLSFSVISDRENVAIVNQAKLICFANVGGQCSDHIPTGANFVKLDTKRGTLMPNPIAAVSSLGITEISLEPMANSPTASSKRPWDTIALEGGLPVVEALERGVDISGKNIDGTFSKMIELASRAGVSVAVTVPKDPKVGIVKGISTAIFTSGNGLAKKYVGVHVLLGRDVSGSDDYFDSITGQLDYLKRALFKAEVEFRKSSDYSGYNEDSTNNEIYRKHKFNSTELHSNAFISVLDGEIPLIVHVNSAEQIEKLLDMLQDVENEHKSSRVKMVIVGGSEAWMVAKRLKETDTAVILTPVRCIPEHLDSKFCASMSSLMHPILFPLRPGEKPAMTGISILRDNGVRFAVGPADDNMINSLLWDAGWAKSMSNKYVDGSAIHGIAEMSVHEAVGLVTWAVADILGLTEFASIKLDGDMPNFSVYVNDHHPTEDLRANLAITVASMDADSNQSLIRCMPRPL